MPGIITVTSGDVLGLSMKHLRRRGSNWWPQWIDHPLPSLTVKIKTKHAYYKRYCNNPSCELNCCVFFLFFYCSHEVKMTKTHKKKTNNNKKKEVTVTEMQIQEESEGVWILFEICLNFCALGSVVFVYVRLWKELFERKKRERKKSETERLIMAMDAINIRDVEGSG